MGFLHQLEGDAATEEQDPLAQRESIREQGAAEEFIQGIVPADVFEDQAGGDVPGFKKPA